MSKRFSFNLKRMSDWTQRWLKYAIPIVVGITLISGAPRVESAGEAQNKVPIARILTEKIGADNVVKLEVASTPEEIETGLMHRTSIPEDHGMVFLFKTPDSPTQHVQFWMYHCLMSLDMLFIKNGRIIKICENVPPCYSENKEKCPKYPDRMIEVTEVLELQAGYAKKHHVREGDSVVFELPEIGKTPALRVVPAVNNEQITARIDDSIAIVTLNRPEAKNAISTDMWRALPTVLVQQQKAGARAVIITGSGDAFAAGADLEELSEIKTREHAREFWVAIEHCLSEVDCFGLPTIAMINGACVGGGCLLAMSCDLRFAAERATFGVPVAKLGIVIDDNCVQRLISLVGDATARWLLFSGMQIDGAEAQRLGLVNKVFADDQLFSGVRQIASQIVHNDQHSLLELKASLTRIRQGNQKTRVQQRRSIVESYLRSDLQDRIAEVKKRIARLRGQSD
jgi:enoyl-CoA hydratase/carnithine racemase/uncharacterized membrane protein (UPF0127 family)